MWEQPSLTITERQLGAKLHTYFGLTKKDVTRASLVKSLAYVYAEHDYTPTTLFGPFLPNGDVDWVLLKAVHHLVSMHIAPKDLEKSPSFHYQMSMPLIQIVKPDGVDFDTAEDWAGVSGVWEVSYCVCIADTDPNPMIANSTYMSFFERPDVRELFRSFKSKLSVTKTEKDPDNPKRHIIHFTGDLYNAPLPTSVIKGSVKTTDDDQVHWSLVIGDQAGTIRTGEGIHIGGLQSWFGVLGTWRNADIPLMGPFWLRKLEENSPVDL